MLLQRHLETLTSEYFRKCYFTSIQQACFQKRLASVTFHASVKCYLTSVRKVLTSLQQVHIPISRPLLVRQTHTAFKKLRKKAFPKPATTVSFTMVEKLNTMTEFKSSFCQVDRISMQLSFCEKVSVTTSDLLCLEPSLCENVCCKDLDGF